MPQLAITVLGHDRPGIIAETTAALASLGVNIEDSTMTLLRGHFAMMLVTDTAAPEADVEAALGGLAADGSLSVDVREIPDEGVASVGTAYLLSVHGGDRPGIVSSVVTEVAAVGGNITDLSTRLSGDLYVLLAECDLPAGVDAAVLEARIRAVADELGVGASLRPLESDDL
ncbi:MAG TPA: ACT domain-containing protein [Marmoricola sp.]